MGELLLRYRGKYKLFSFKLKNEKGYKRTTSLKWNLTLKYAVQQPKPTPQDIEHVNNIIRLYEKWKDKNLIPYPIYLFYEWNSEYVKLNKEEFKKWPIPLRIFNGNGSIYPRFRYSPNTSIKVTGNIVRLNSFGWRGKEFEVPKPKNIYRIVCLGASVTHGLNKISYPELLEVILQKKLPYILYNGDIQIEVLNAGIDGHNSDDLLAKLKTEVVKSQPDMIIYYEGFNDIKRKFWKMRESQLGISQPFITPMTSLDRDKYKKINPLCKYSALWKSVLDILNKKCETLPVISNRSLKVWDINEIEIRKHFKEVIANVNEMVQFSKNNNIQFILTSYVVLAHGNLELDANEDIIIWNRYYEWLYPLSYSEIQEMFRIINNEYKILAMKEHVLFLDIYAKYPQLPLFFTDPIHFTQKGDEVMAEIVAELLIPHLVKILEKKYGKSR